MATICPACSSASVWAIGSAPEAVSLNKVPSRCHRLRLGPQLGQQLVWSWKRWLQGHEALARIAGTPQTGPDWCGRGRKAGSDHGVARTALWAVNEGWRQRRLSGSNSSLKQRGQVARSVPMWVPRSAAEPLETLSRI